MLQPPVDAGPRRGRAWILLALGLFAAVLAVAVVSISTREPGSSVVRLSGVSDAQRIFGGLRQDGDRLGPPEAPVSIQVFADLQCGPCREDFLGTIPRLVEEHVRPGDVKLLLRHYSVAENPLEVGFFGAEAAAKQAYGWQYTYLFFRNQDEAERFGVDEGFMASLASGIDELEVAEWKRALEAEGGPEGPFARRLERFNEIGTELGIRTGVAMIVSGPGGTRTLQDGPSYGEIEAAIAAVR